MHVSQSLHEGLLRAAQTVYEVRVISLVKISFHRSELLFEYVSILHGGERVHIHLLQEEIGQIQSVLDQHVVRYLGFITHYFKYIQT